MVQYSHGDGKVSTLLFCSSKGDGERGLNHLHLVDKLDSELVMIDCTEGTRRRRRRTDENRKHSLFSAYLVLFYTTTGGTKDRNIIILHSGFKV